MEGPQRRLDREGDEESQEEDLLRRRIDIETDQCGEVEGPLSQLLGRHDVEPDEGREHEQAADEAVDEELHRRVRPVRTAVAPDEEVDGDEHDLEEDVEQEHVGGGEDADHQRLEHQDQREVALDASTVLDVVPAGQDRHRDQRRRQCHQHQADAVDAHGVGDAEGRDPWIVLDELEGRGGVGVELQAHDDGEYERREGEHESGLLDQPDIVARQDEEHEGAEERHDAQDREPGDRRHGSLTTARMTTTRTAPPTMASA